MSLESDNDIDKITNIVFCLAIADGIVFEYPCGNDIFFPTWHIQAYLKPLWLISPDQNFQYLYKYLRHTIPHIYSEGNIKISYWNVRLIVKSLLAINVSKWEKKLVLILGVLQTFFGDQ